jgi:hypothetical protein
MLKIFYNLHMFIQLGHDLSIKFQPSSSKELFRRDACLMTKVVYLFNIVLPLLLIVHSNREQVTNIGLLDILYIGLRFNTVGVSTTGGPWTDE